jgi:hypothetical protein
MHDPKGPRKKQLIPIYSTKSTRVLYIKEEIIYGNHFFTTVSLYFEAYSTHNNLTYFKKSILYMYGYTYTVYV